MNDRRQVGVRRTRRKTILLMVGILVCVACFWQLFSPRNSFQVVQIEDTANAEVKYPVSSHDVTSEPSNQSKEDGPAEGQATRGQLVLGQNAKISKNETPLPADNLRDDVVNSSVTDETAKTDEEGDIMASDSEAPSDGQRKVEGASDNESNKAAPVYGNGNEKKPQYDDRVPSQTPKPINNDRIIVEDNDRMVKQSDNDDTNVANQMVGGGLQYNYTRPRYAASSVDGQFRFLKFVAERGNTSRDYSLISSPFSDFDKVCLTLLSQGEIREIYSIRNHERLRLVAFDAPTLYRDVMPIESCPMCGAIKSPKDIDEVLAFHVDRTMAIARALPVSGRRFSGDELGNLGFEENTRREDIFPVTWFARDLIHGGDFQKDQNSLQLTWRHYQDILRDCSQPDSKHDCTGVNYSDWSRMAVLDFVMQNHDRLDRYCCGYDRDEGEACFHNEIPSEIKACDDVTHRFLVHLLVSKSHPDRLVLLDNAGNLRRSSDHLNYELLTGIKTIPKSIMANVHSDDLRDRLLHSLRWDTVYWQSLGEELIKRKVDTIIQRVDKLRAYIEERGIETVPG